MLRNKNVSKLPDLVKVNMTKKKELQNDHKKITISGKTTYTSAGGEIRFFHCLMIFSGCLIVFRITEKDF